MAGKTILILGGGIGGIATANTLARRLAAEHRIIVVDKSAQHEFAPSFLWVMVGERKPQQVTTALRRLLHPRVEFVCAAVTGLDVGTQTVTAGDRTLNFDYLVFALGAGLAPETVPGLAEAAHTSFSLAGAARLWETVQQFKGGRVAVVIARLPFKCPAAPYETALLLRSAFDQRKVAVQMDLYTPEPMPMPVAGPSVGGALREMVESAGIAYHPLTNLQAVDGAQKTLAFANATSVPYDLLVAIPPHSASPLARTAGLANEAGWIPVDSGTLQTKQDRIFAIGDATAILLQGRWKPDVPLLLPKAGVFAHRQAVVVASNIAAAIEGQAASAAFDGFGYCMVETGDGLAALGAGDFFAVPSPSVKLEPPKQMWHWGKVLFEKYWLATGPVREFYRSLLIAGSQSRGYSADF